MKKNIFICVVSILLIITTLLFIPASRSCINEWFFNLEKIDDLTTYKTRKEVEDTCRSMISSYISDKLMYEQYKDKTGEQLNWAEAAKTRANKTAIQYNEYILKNNFVFKDNIPSDIKYELELIY